MTKLLYIPDGKILTFQQKDVQQEKRTPIIEEGYLFYKVGGTIEELIRFIINLTEQSGFKERNKIPKNIIREEFEVIYD